DQDLGVVGGQHRHEGGRLFVVAVGAPVHVQQLGSARLAADAVARHIGAVAAAAGGAVAHLVLHDLADGLAGAAADDLAADARPDLLHHVAVGVHDLVHHMGGDQIAAVDRRRHRRAHLQGGHRHGLAKSGGGQLHLAHVLVGVVLHVAGLVGQVHAGALGKAKGLEIVVKGLDPDPLAQLDEVDVAAVQQGVGQVLGAVAVAPGAVVGLLGHGIGAAAVEGGVVGGVARIHPHGRGDDLKDAAGIVQLGDGLVFPHDVPEIARVVGVGVQDPVAIFVGDKGAV